MQSLGQAVYRYVCYRSPEGVGKREIVKEMDSRGYLPPLKKRVDDALHDYMTMNPARIKLKKGRFVKVDRMRSTPLPCTIENTVEDKVGIVFRD